MEEKNEQAEAAEGQAKAEEKQPEAQEKKKTYVEERVVRGEQLMDTLQELLRESSVRRIRVINSEGRVVLDIPVWAAAVGGAAAIIALPILSAVGVVGGLLAGFKVEIEREAKE